MVICGSYGPMIRLLCEEVPGVWNHSDCFNYIILGDYKGRSYDDRSRSLRLYVEKASHFS